jgi:hypothetical protein
MAKRREPVKDLVAWETESADASAGVRDAFRLYTFTLAEALFPERFEELKRQALPIYKRAFSQPVKTPVIGTSIRSRVNLPEGKTESCIAIDAETLKTVCLHLRDWESPRDSQFSVSATVELERRIEAWAAALNIVQPGQDDGWLRELAFQRVALWCRGGEFPSPIIGGVVCEISKEGWEPVETCFWFSPASILPPFPRRGVGFSSASPSAWNRPTT